MNYVFKFEVGFRIALHLVHVFFVALIIFLSFEYESMKVF